MDPVSRRDFWLRTDALARAGTTVLVTTHYLDEAERCDRVAIIHGGRIAAMGPTRELKVALAARRERAPQTGRVERDVLPTLEDVFIDVVTDAAATGDAA